MVTLDFSKCTTSDCVKKVFHATPILGAKNLRQKLCFHIRTDTTSRD
jgi:hypothetical protein